MHRKKLIELLVIAATAALCGCATAPAPQHTAEMRQEADKDLGNARNAWSECVRAAMPKQDDPQTPSEVVARAAMKACSDEYTAMLRVLAQTLGPACGRDPDCTRGALAKAEREATQAATDYVVTERVRTAGATVLKCE